MNDVTRILSQIQDGNPSAAEQLLPLVYDELRKLAAGIYGSVLLSRATCDWCPTTVFRSSVLDEATCIDGIQLLTSTWIDGFALSAIATSIELFSRVAVW
jgi:hypothetical protein